MTEFNRERILEERSEQKQRLQNARALADMVKQQQRGGGGGVAPGDDSVSRAAKRMLHFCLYFVSVLIDDYEGQHTARGATKEKTQRLDELKAKRKAKDDKKRVSHATNASSSISSSHPVQSPQLSLTTRPFRLTSRHGYI